MEIDVTPNISLPRKIRREVKHAIGRIAGYGINQETGHTYGEERKLRRLEKKAHPDADPDTSSEI